MTSDTRPKQAAHGPVIWAGPKGGPKPGPKFQAKTRKTLMLKAKTHVWTGPKLLGRFSGLALWAAPRVSITRGGRPKRPSNVRISNNG